MVSPLYRLAKLSRLSGEGGAVEERGTSFDARGCSEGHIIGFGSNSLANSRKAAAVSGYLIFQCVRSCKSSCVTTHSCRNPLVVSETETVDKPQEA
jgi:hypothetical protein